MRLASGVAEGKRGNGVTGRSERSERLARRSAASDQNDAVAYP